METAGDELYFVNTKFSCLCVKDAQLRFKPVWRPPFSSLLQPLEICHLNGFFTRDNQPHYVTALGQTDEPLCWRTNKANGDILMDIQSNEMLAQGLSMPHSPRWHQGRLWLLESDKKVPWRITISTSRRRSRWRVCRALRADGISSAT